MPGDCVPYYEGAYARKLTVAIITTAAVARRFIGPMTSFQSGPGLASTAEGGNLQAVGVPAAGGEVGGVAAFDGAIGGKIAVYSGEGVILPCESGAAVAVGDELKVDAQGRVIPQGGTGRKVGKAHSSAAGAGTDVAVELYAIPSA